MTEPDPLPRQLHALVTHLHATANRDLLEQINREQLTFQRIQLLERLRGGRVRPTIQQCATIMQVAVNSASRLVTDLENRGLVRRVTDENDQRTRRVEITDGGEAVLIRLHAARTPAIVTFAERLTSEQREQLAAALTLILNPEPKPEREHAAAA